MKHILSAILLFVASAALAAETGLDASLVGAGASPDRGRAGALVPTMPAAELDLAGEWTLISVKDIQTGTYASTDKPEVSPYIPATVPGGVHDALLRAGRIKDVYYGSNETNALWVGKCNWIISRSVDVSGDFLRHGQIVLRLEDCDTFASVFVNGGLVGSTTDRFQRYTFDVKKYLKEGKNEISVVFRSPEDEADSRRKSIGKPYPMANVAWAKNQALIRKPACHAGWDWGPSVQSIGLCGTVKLIASDKPRIDYVYTTQSFNADLSHCTLDVFADLSDGSTVTNRIEIDNPPLWWPNGAGEQNFYTYTVDVNGEKVTRRIGLRKLEVLNEKTTSKDGKDELSLVFRVNNKRLFMKGANWIPCDAYESRQTPQRYRDLLESARAANMNMIRVWGGGQYEKDVFYDLCDELGILLWHDMMCSCAVYPGDDQFLDEIRTELEHQLRRLRDHASIALWCGDNECLGAIKWFDETKKDPDFYRGEWLKRSKMQGELVAKYDPTRTYWPSSPCCGPGDFGDGWKEDSKGDMHNWDVWHENAPFDKYYDYHPRFCSEFGFQSFPSLEIAETFASKEQILSRGPDFEWHQKNPGGNRRIRKTLERYFPEPKDVPSELLLSQFQQAMAIQTAVDAWRSEQPRCMGTLFWQLNDNWPVASLSSIEYGGKWKPLQYLAKRFFEPVNVVVKPDASGADLVFGVNDTSEEVKGELIVERCFYAGDQVSDRVIRENRIDVYLAPNAATKLTTLATPKTSFCGGTFVVLTLKTDRGIFTTDRHFQPFRFVQLGKPTVKAAINGFAVTLTTDRPALWVWMNAKGIRGEFDDNAVTLVPGQPRTFTFKPKDAVTPEAFKAAFSVTHLAELCKGKTL